MKHQFCTSCGHSAAVDSRFCENCGAVSLTLEPGTTPQLSKTEQEAVLPLRRTRGLIGTWIMPFNATLIFGGTLAGVFDFLSPRIALLPIAASVVVTGLVVAICLRKFVAPGLPEASKLKRALAPAAGLHRSPLLIVTGVLSALMVTGAAWSSAASASGGVIASKFDGARNAQMQLGVLQGLQKEQRIQTAVMEDIREGRAADPRRELSNIGGGFSEGELDAALRRGDFRTASLLMAGGMKWSVTNAYDAFSRDDQTIAELLLKNLPLLDIRPGDCERLIAEKFHIGNQYITVGGIGGQTSSFPVADQSSELKIFQKKHLKMFCSRPEVLSFVKSTMAEMQRKIDEDRQLKEKNDASRLLCQVNTREERDTYLKQMQFNKRYGIKEKCAISDCSYKGDVLRLAAKDAEKYEAAVQLVCLEEFQISTKEVEQSGKRSLDIYLKIFDFLSAR